MLEPINWKTDPLLLDPEPTPMNEWFTANKILSSDSNNADSIIDNKTLTLNLYPILIRKIDFVLQNKNDRVLTRFPYRVLTKDEIKFIQSNVLTIAHIVRDYFYPIINDKISIWRKRIEKYLERGAIPFPLLRCAWEAKDFPKKQTNELKLESAKGKTYSLPCIITKKLAYLCGVVNGDGHLHHHWLRVIDETKEHIELISHLYNELFSDSGKIFQTGNAWNAELRSSSAVRLINFLTSQTIKGAKYATLKEPLIFKKIGEPYRRLYWRGAMDADGSYKQHISFSSASEKYANDFSNYLDSLDIKSKIGKVGNYAHNLTIPALYRLNFIKHIGVDNPKKKADMIQLLKMIRFQFKGLKKENLLDGILFDLTKINSLNIIGLGDYLINLRGTKSLERRSKELGISVRLYSEYESEERAISIKTLQKINGFSNRDVLELFLNKNNLTYQISTSKPIRLPVKVTSDIIELMNVLEPKKNYVKILINNDQVKSKTEQYFGIKTDNHRINSRLAVNFISTFGIYEKPEIADLELESILVL